MPKARGKAATARIPFPVRASERPSKTASSNGRARRSPATPRPRASATREPNAPASPSSKPRAATNTREPKNPPRETSKPRQLAKPRRPTVRPLDMDETLKARELFWANVIREILCSLADESRRVAEARRHQLPSQLPPGAQPPPPGPRDPQTMQAPPTEPESILDGRFAVVTNYGERIPIAEVKPLFAMGVDRSPETRALSVAVECSVFQIRSPKGFVYTIPIHEIRAIRAVSEELMDELEAHANREDQSTTHPFGFAAFTSLARAGLHRDIERDIELPPVTDEGYGE